MAFLKPRFASLTDVGVKRSHNQDACAAQPAADDARFTQVGHLFIVADGMGGHAVGEKASAMAVRGIPLTFQKYVAQEGVVAAIRRAFKDTNAEIFDIGTNTPEFKGLGTTGTALILRPEGAWIGHVGDSRAYRIRAGKIEQLTFDHSWVWEIARRQGIDPDELGDFKKNVIVRSLGPDAEVVADIEGPHPLEPGDTFLLCSDGLSNQVPADELGAIVSTMPPDEAAKFLIELANLRGGPDNITAVIVQIPGSTPSTTHATLSKLQPPRFAGLRKVFNAADKVVPWSYSALGMGTLLAVASFILRGESKSGAGALFLVAAACIVLGIVGLIRHFRSADARAASEAANEGVGELRTYKTYTFEVGPKLVERINEVETQLSETLKGHDDGVDWKAHKKWSDESADKLGKSDAPAAFRARCKAVSVLAKAWNTDRSKVESFSPNYTPR
ncbi:hypothetical protein BH11PLA2_BH11PLA2_01890 [soil metagenome]